MARTLLTLLLGSLALAPALALSGCEDDATPTEARRVMTRSDLVGGPSALGEVGDYLLENDKIRVVIQDTGFSRGFGVYGGGLIDADLKRSVSDGDALGGKGRDQWGELFPIFFLQALEPDSVEVLEPGEDGAARVRVSGEGADFLTLTKALNRAVMNSHELDAPNAGALLNNLFPVAELSDVPTLRYEIDYELLPGVRHVRIRTRLINLTDADLDIPLPAIQGLLGLLTGSTINDFQVPLGAVLLFGAGNDVFAPGHGYDIRWSLEESYETQVPFPALAGLLVPGLVSTSANGISYGFFALPDDEVTPFAAGRKTEAGDNVYAEAYGVEPQPDTMLVPFLASSFTGLFYAQAPNVLPPGGRFEYSNYFVVGDGDAASVFDEIHRLRDAPVGTLVGDVYDAVNNVPVDGASVIVYAGGRPVNQFFSDRWGRFKGTLPPGDYVARVADDPSLGPEVPFSIEAGKGEFLSISRPTPALISVDVKDAAGSPLPAKITVVGTYGPENVGRETRNFLFDLAVGEHWRTQDLVPDDADDPRTRRFIEATGFTEKGRARLHVRPGTYEIYVSRGIEYDLHQETVQVEAGRAVEIAALLNRVVDTPGYISADFHVHAAPSLDSAISIHERMLTGAGEGLELLAATDHNFITDYAPYIERAGLEEWMSSIVGIELTTLESGHFNAYPVKRDIGQITRGSFEWSLRPPDEIFDTLRQLGTLGPDKTIVQVNHPRDEILGYFSQYDFDALTAEIKPLEMDPISQIIAPNGPAFVGEDGTSQFSFAFDAIEVLNGSVLGQRDHVRMPDLQIPDDEAAREAFAARLGIEPDVLDELPEAGTILCEDGEVAFPGVIDDWFNLLNAGYRYIGIGTSDAHDAEEMGYFRTYVHVGHDEPLQLNAAQIVDGLQSRRAVMTNGPFLEVTVNGQPIGSELSDEDGRVDVRVDVQAAPWIEVNRGAVYVNGEARARFDVELDDGRFVWEETLNLPRDSWIVVDVRGDQSMFPVVPPIDVPPVLLSEAFAAFAGPLGLGGSDLGDLEPPRTSVWTPLAVTNPVWVNVDGGEWDAPGVQPRACRDFGVIDMEPGMDAKALRAEQKPRVPRYHPSFGGMPRLKGDLMDVRVIFEHFAGHSH